MQTDKFFFFQTDWYLFNKHSQFWDEINYPMTYNIRNKAMYMQSWKLYYTLHDALPKKQN